MSNHEAVLGTRQVFILPTRHGLLFMLVLVALALAAVNYSNALAYLLTFLLASMAVVLMADDAYLFAHQLEPCRELAEALGRTVCAITERLFVLRQRAWRTTKPRKVGSEVWAPTPEEIAAGCREAQERWSDRERHTRAGKPDDSVEMRVINTYGPAVGPATASSAASRHRNPSTSRTFRATILLWQ